jgi:hypothetical protein
VFYGAYDWHSAVHAHWAMARVAHLFPDSRFATPCREALERSLTREGIEGELSYLRVSDRRAFELPYGMAWLLTVDAELLEWPHPSASALRELVAPLVQLARDRIVAWCARLPRPVRTGEHTQSAFGFCLALDWARRTTDFEAARELERHALRLHEGARDASLHLEPSAYDFLSPALAEADLMRRVLDSAALAEWLGSWLPLLPTDSATSPLEPVACPDPSDPRLSHLIGLNLSRAWMLEGIASALPDRDARRAALKRCADLHGRAGLAAVSEEHYAGSHWHGSFALYWGTGRGISQA